MAGTRVQLRGNERIQQLMEEFPLIPRTLVVKADLIRQGIRKTEAARHLGRWALPEAPWYFEYSHENARSAGEIGNGYFLSPLIGFFSNKVCWQFLWDPKSPYELRYEGAGRYQLYRDDEPIEEVFFSPRPRWYDRKTSSGKPMSSIITQRGEDQLTLAALTYCEYFKDSGGCDFCNIVQAESTRKGQGLVRVTSKHDQDIYETFTAAAQEGGAAGLIMSGGVIIDVKKETDNYVRITKALRQAMKDLGHECPINLTMQATETEDILRIREAGVGALSFNVEVWGARLFEIICPGKAKHVGWDRWLERLLAAREVYGQGNTFTNFVIGVELVHPDGFKTEDESLASVLEGCKWMHDHGVWPAGQFFHPGPGTMFADRGIAPPRTEYFLRAELARYKLAEDCGKGIEPTGLPPTIPYVSILADLRALGLRKKPSAA